MACFSGTGSHCFCFVFVFVCFFFVFLRWFFDHHQVRLPRNQLFVTRVTGRTQLADLLHTVCNEKDLDPSHYEFRHPGTSKVNEKQKRNFKNCRTEPPFSHANRKRSVFTRYSQRKSK